MGDSGVKIVVRIRNSDLDKKEESEKIVHSHSTEKKILMLEDRAFVFDQVLDVNISQENVYKHLVEPLVLKTISGFNSTVIAFGQSGSGKTYTIGLQLDTYQTEFTGIISRALDDIFLKTNSFNLHTETIVSVSYIEIYNEKVFDLLSNNFTEPINTKASKFTGGTKKQVQMPSEARHIIIEGNKNRHVRETKMNPCSSRSHAIFTIHLLTTDENTQKMSALNLVDLAGSESVRRTGHQKGLAFSEGIHINQGLLCVSKVLHALSSGLKVIPYRDSILSTVLQDSLNLNSYLTLIACISPLSEDINETLSTLRYAKGAKLIKNNPQINAILADLQKTRTKTPTPKKQKRPDFIHPSTIKKRTPSNRSILFTPKENRNTMNYLHYNRYNENKVELFTSNKKRITGPIYKKEDNLTFINDSIESRPSMQSFNMSSSTTIDAPQIISPIVRKVSEIFDDKFKKLYDCIENLSTVNNLSTINELTRNEQSNANFVTENLTDSNINSNSTRFHSTLTKEEFQTILRDELFSLQNYSTPMPVIINDQNIETEKESESRVEVSETTQSTNFSRNLGHNENNDCNKVVNPRRSVRISIRKYSFTKPLTPPRYSRKRSIIKLNSESDSTTLNETPIINQSSTRFSNRLSLKSQLVSNRINQSTTKKLTNRKSVKKDISEVKKITDFLTRDTNPGSLKNAKAKHQKAILELINNGTIKEIQILPVIGLKTAFQIVTHRLLHGKYKSFNELSKLNNIWKGKSWIRFKEANHIN